MGLGDHSYLSTFLASGLIVGLAHTVYRARKDAQRTRLPKELVVRAANVQIPMAPLAEELAKFVKEQAEMHEKGDCLETILSRQGASGERIHAFSPDGRRVRQTSNQRPGGEDEHLTGEERGLWKDAADSGGGWCAYFEGDRDKRLICEYAYITYARGLFFSSGMRIG